MILFLTIWLIMNDGRYNNSPLKDWFDGLKNSQNEGCCSVADGQALTEDEWTLDKDQYKVLIDGKWYDVPKSAVLNQQNKVGKPMVWAVPYWIGPKLDHMRIRCFLPGTLI